MLLNLPHYSFQRLVLAKLDIVQLPIDILIICQLHSKGVSCCWQSTNLLSIVFALELICSVLYQFTISCGSICRSFVNILSNFKIICAKILIILHKFEEKVVYKRWLLPCLFGESLWNAKLEFRVILKNPCLWNVLQLIINY